MKFIIALTLFFSLAEIPAAIGSSYYFSSVTGDDARTSQQAQQMATPWRTINKLNSIFPSLKPGDTVYLQCGSVFTGPLRVTQSGAAGKPISIAAYGSGALPIITGFAALTSWVSAGSNIWQSSCPSCGLRVNMLKVADSAQPMGRYPNSNAANGGYAIIQSHTDVPSTITDPKLAGTPNWTGAELVIRKNRHVMEKDLITLHSGTKITYNAGSEFNAINKFGYFIQNSLKTLDRNGEWYYDPLTHKMNMYWTSNPSGIPISASTVDTLINITKRQYLSFRRITFQGSNGDGIFIIQSSYVTFTDCSVLFSGLNGMKTIQTANLIYQGGSIDYSNNNGIDLDGSSNYIQDCRVVRSGTIPGTGNAIRSYMGITINGSNNYIQYVNVDTSGYSGIEFVGGSNTIRNNLVDYYGFTKDDAGGIYTWSGDIDSATRRIGGWITNNIVLNGQTVPAGTDSLVKGIAHGIYLDMNTGVTNVTGNTVANCTAGIFIQDSHELTVSGNTFFNNLGQICLRHAVPTGTLRNNDVTNNIAVSLTDSQNVLQASSVSPLAGPPRLSSFAYLHANKYARISSTSQFFLMALQGLNLTGSFGLWKSAYSFDWDSKELPLNFAPYTINRLIGSNLYTKGDIITPFATTPAGNRVIVSTPFAALYAGKAYVVHFTLHAPDAAHTLLLFLQKYTSPYTHFTPVISVTTGTPLTNNTIVFDSTTGTDPVPSIVFQMNQSDPRIYIDNIDMYQADVTANNPATNYLFRYNATKSPTVVAFSGTYQDAGGTAYSGSVTLQPYTSIVLFRK